MFFLYFLIIIFSITLHSISYSNEKPPEVGILEKLGQKIDLNLKFTDEDGKQVVLKELVDKPTIIAFVYFHCPGICSPLQTGLAEVIDRADIVPGKDYRALSISFDHKEGPDKAKKWQKQYLSGIKRKINPEDWKFLTGDSITIQKITDQAGFYFKPDGKNDFIHSATLIVISPEGKIARYLLGTQFLPFDLKMAVIEASQNKWSPTISKILQYCYSYDPEGRKYVFNVTRVAGTIIFLAIGAFFAILLIKGRKNKQNKGE